MTCREGCSACFKGNWALKACVTGCPYKQTQTRSEHMRCLSLFPRFASSGPSSSAHCWHQSLAHRHKHRHAVVHIHTSTHTHANPANTTIAVILLALRGTPMLGLGFIGLWHSSDRYYSCCSAYGPGRTATQLAADVCNVETHDQKKQPKLNISATNNANLTVRSAT